MSVSVETFALVTCDRCKVETRTKQMQRGAVRPSQLSVNFPTPSGWQTVDLCDNCANSLVRWFQNVAAK